MMLKFIIYATVLHSYQPFYNNSNQCSTYDFQLINYIDTTNITTLINEKSKNNNNKIQEYQKEPFDELKKKVEYYLNLIGNNRNLIIKNIWIITFVFLSIIGYIYIIKNIDYNTLYEYYNI